MGRRGEVVAPAHEEHAMKIGILGSGNVGRALGSGLASLGHDVKMGSRDPGSERVRAWVAQAGARASAGTPAEAAAFGQVVVLATPWSATEEAIEAAGPQAFAGKVVIDATNPLDLSKGAPALALGFTDSAGERVQRRLPAARVVKAFNTVGADHMVRPQFPGGPPTMFLCGNDVVAKRTVGELCGALGWAAVDAGGIEAARLLEPLAMLWITYAIRSGSRNHAFRILRK